MAFHRALSLPQRSHVLRPHSRPLDRAVRSLAFDSTVSNAHRVEHVIVAAPGLSRTTSNDGWRPSARVQAAERALHSHIEVP